MLAIALGCAAVVVIAAVGPAFGEVVGVNPLGVTGVSPAKTLRLAKQAVRIAKRANVQSTKALHTAGRPGPAGPPGPRGSEGLDGPQGPDGENGPRGATGLDGATGTSGATGAGGSKGATGATGPQGPGSARAYATVDPASPLIVGARSAGFASVSRPSGDRYCLTPVSGLDLSSSSPAVSVDVGRSTGAVNALFATVDSTGASCGAGDVTVVTSGPAANAVGFSILVP
jgi:hypothetical protein